MSTRDSIGAIRSVLIVDDSDVQRNHAVRLCQSMGMRIVHTATNGSEALSLLAALPSAPELLIVDLEMPTMDGSQLLEQLQRQGIDIPILVASSRESALIDLVGEMGGALGLRVIAALKKPLSAEGLRRALSQFAAAALPQRVREVLTLKPEDLAAGIDGGQIHVHYQPKVDVRTGIVRGVEALARWTHPTLGAVPAADFIRLAEQCQLIHALTMRVMGDAMLQAAYWMAHGLHLSMAINLSPQLLDRSELVDEIISLQEIYGLRAESVIFEITEGSLVGSHGVALGILARLRLTGFGLSIDDYGTGFSSMQQLARIPFTELKIDRSFVHNAHERKNLQVILRSALELGNKLGITTVAEGVETMEDWRLLRKFGCTLAQGFLIAKPMSAADLAGWLKAYRLRRGDLCAPDPAGVLATVANL